MRKYHRLNYRLPIEHSIDGQEIHRHNHLIEIEVVVRHQGGHFRESESINSILDQVLGPYQHKYLNEFPEFDGDVSMGNLGRVFFERLNYAFEGAKWKLARFEISETPLQVFAISVEDF